MKQWDIWTCDFAEAGSHPAIIVSHPDRVARAAGQRADRLQPEGEPSGARK